MTNAYLAEILMGVGEQIPIVSDDLRLNSTPCNIRQSNRFTYSSTHHTRSILFLELLLHVHRRVDNIGGIVQPSGAEKTGFES